MGKNILIIGGGYGGIAAAKKLAKRCKNNEDIAITLVDKHPWYFRPFRGGNCLDPAWDNLEESAGAALAAALAGKARELGKNGITP